MTDPRTPTYDQLSALCAQMAATVEEMCAATNSAERFRARSNATSALTAYRTLSPDPQWQKVPEGCVVVPEKLTEEMFYAGLRYLNSLRDCPYPGMQPSVPNFWASIIERARGEG